MGQSNKTPLEGTWTVTGSERSYDWIGQNSTIPFLGFVFKSFDRFIPFTSMIMLIRRFFGAGTDTMNGTQYLTVNDCGRSIEFMGRTFERTQNGYINTSDVGGTIHTIKIFPESEESISASYRFSLGNVNARMPPSAKAKARAAGVDLSQYEDLTFESDRPFKAHFSGSAKQRARAIKKRQSCDCHAVFQYALGMRVSWEGYGAENLRQLATNQGWSIERYIETVNKHYEPVAKHLFKQFGYDPRLATFKTAATTDGDGLVEVEDTNEMATLPNPVREAIILHETIHVKQHALLKAEQAAGKPFKEETPWDRGGTEKEAYAVSLEHLLHWLRQNCDGKTHAKNIPDWNRNLFRELNGS